MFTVLGKVASIVIDTVTLPVAVAVDVVTLGGELTDRNEPYTVSNVKNIAHNAESLLAPNLDVR